MIGMENVLRNTCSESSGTEGGIMASPTFRHCLRVSQRIIVAISEEMATRQTLHRMSASVLRRSRAVSRFIPLGPFQCPLLSHAHRVRQRSRPQTNSMAVVSHVLNVGNP